MDFLVKPWAHQKDAIVRASALDHFALFFEMGAGKTMTSINCLRLKMLKHKRLLRTLVLCPPIVVENWRREFLQHSKVGKSVFPLVGTGREREQALARLDGKPAIIVTNYESLLMPGVLEQLKRWYPEAIIFDESHKLKNIAAKRTKVAIQLADMATYKWILSGTPVLNTPLDLFSQFRILDGGQIFGKNFFFFRAHFFEDRNVAMPKANYFPNWQPRVGSLEDLNRRIKPVSMVVKKEDCLDLPPLVKQTVFVELSKQQQKLYEAMKKDFIAYVAGGACVANLAITKALRLQQIVSGFVALEGKDGGDRTEVVLKDNPRAAALKELLEDIAPHSKVLVWAVFKNNYEVVRQTCAELGIELVEVHGEVTAVKRQEAVDRFSSDPKVRVLLGHPQSAGIGVNLVAAAYSIYYSRNFSLENDAQSEARNYRGGSQIHEKVTRIDLVARDTIDELITEKLAAKIEVGETILKDLAGKL